MSEDNNKFRILELLAGPFKWQNYCKVIVFALCAGVIFLIGVGAVSIKNKYLTPKPTIPAQTQSVGANSGTIATSNDTSTTQVIHHHYPLSDIFNLFHWEKIDRKEIKKSS